MTNDGLFRLVLAGLLTGLVDGMFSSVLSVAFYGSTATRLFQGVAATLLGPDAFNGGTRTALVGLLMHFGVAFGWSAVFLLLVTKSSWIRGQVAAPYGVLLVVVRPLDLAGDVARRIPVLVHRAPAVTIRWWVQLIGHIPFVALPIVAAIGRTVNPEP
jgi:hypothetical protein